LISAVPARRLKAGALIPYGTATPPADAEIVRHFEAKQRK